MAKINTKKINTCSSLYTPKVMEAFKNPHNYGKIKNADGIGKVGNIVCGDVMWLYIKIAKNAKKEEIIKDVKFETFGCVAAISTSSTITDLAKGKTIKQALKIEKDDIVKIIYQNGHSLGIGKVQYDSEKAREMLGKKNQKPLVHCDYLYLE